jgi:hypothetical protein
MQQAYVEIIELDDRDVVEVMVVEIDKDDDENQ